MFAKHLPPSANQPRVLALDAASAASLPPEVELTLLPNVPAMAEFDAIIGTASERSLSGCYKLLRPGGRLILVSDRDSADSLLENLTEAGFIHCLVEIENGLTLYRGERPPMGASTTRLASLTTAPPPSQIQTLKFIYLLVAQTPNKPAWKLLPDETIRWQAATVLDAQTNSPILLAFSSLVRAVNFMQPAVLAGAFKGINKVGKFASEIAQQWELPLLLNPNFDDLRETRPGDFFDVDPQVAITGEE